MPIPATRRHAANLDLQTNQLLRACLESVAGTPTTFPALGRVAYQSNVGQEHIIVCIGTSGQGTWVNVPRLELAETVSGRWNFTSGGAPFTVSSSTLVANLNAQKVAGLEPSEPLVGATLVQRTSGGSIHVMDGDEPTHAVNLRQLDSAVKGRQDKDAVDAATITSLPAHSATATTLTASANGALPAQDGVTLTAGMSVLIKNESGTAKARHGIYTVTAAGSAGAPWVLTRRADTDESAEVKVGLTTFVDGGTVNRNSVWTLIDASALPIVLGTTELTFSKTGGNTLYQDGNGLTLVGDTFHLGDGSAYTQGDLFVASDAANVSRIAAVAAGNVLRSGGVGALPAWGKVDLTLHVSGGLPVANGGTNSTTALSNGRLMVSSGGKIVERAALTTGWLVVGDGTNGAAAMGSGASDRLVGVNSSNTAHEHKAMSVTAAGVVTAGTWQGTAIGAPYGGTGQTSWAAGDLLYASAINTLSRLAWVADGRFLKSVAGMPAWSTLSAADLGAVTGSGTTNSLPKFTAGTVLGNSSIIDSGGVVTVGARLDVTSRLVVTGNSSGHLAFTQQTLTEVYVPIGGIGWQGTHLQFKPNGAFAGGNAGYNLKRISLSHAVDLTSANATAGLHSALGQTMTITHNLGTTDVVVSARETTHNAENVSVNWRPADANSVEVFFDVVPPSGQYRIVVMG